VTADTPGKIICVIATAALLLVIGYYAGHLKTRPNSIDDALESAHCYIYQQVYNNGNLTQTDMNIYSSYALKLANMQRLLLETNDFEWIKQYNILKINVNNLANISFECILNMNQNITYKEEPMVMPGNKAYDLKCKSCDWQETVIVSEPIIRERILSLFGLSSKLPGKCPKCGSKITKKENPCVCF
jgi:hypothetical protein